MNKERDRIRLAIQKSGRFHDASFGLLNACGIQVARYQDKLCCQCEDFSLDVLLVRDDDIPQFVLDGVCDFGIVGTNVLTEQALQWGIDAQGTIAQALHFSRCRLSLAGPEGFVYQSPESLTGLRIATTYPYLLTDFLNQHGIEASVVKLTGSVEIACGLGIADLICDLVSTGATLRANHLQEVAVIFESQAVLMQSSNPLSPARQRTADIFLNRIQGVFLADCSQNIMMA